MLEITCRPPPSPAPPRPSLAAIYFLLLLPPHTILGSSDSSALRYGYIFCMPAGDRPHHLHPPFQTSMLSLANLTSTLCFWWSTPSLTLIADVNPGTLGDANAARSCWMDQNRVSFPQRMMGYCWVPACEMGNA